MNTLIRFIIRYHTLLFFILLQGMAIFLIARTTGYQKGKLLDVAHATQAFTYDKLADVSAYFSLKRVNDSLLDENVSLHNQLAGYLAVDTIKKFTENDSLYGAKFSYIAARVVNSSINQQRNILTINRGSNHGVRPDMGVICSEGVVGIVTKVSANYSMVLPIINIDSRTSVMLTRNQAFGILSWKGVNAKEAVLSNILQHVDVRVNDTIVTTGYSLIFPPNVHIGTVESFEVKKGNFYEIQVLLAMDFNRLRNVYVVHTGDKAELDSLYTSR